MLPAETHPMFSSKAARGVGYILSALPVLMLLLSAFMKLLKLPAAMEGFAHLGYPQYVALPLGIVEFVSTACYVIPRTSVVGAILLTGYLGGATASHVRVGEPFHMAVLLGVFIWGGLYLREPRLRAVPL